jgi:hypothetical protein
MQHAQYPDLPDDFGHWLAGFIDGEGSFVILRPTTGNRWSLRFQLTLRADDLPIIEEIHRRTGLGIVFVRGPYGKNPNPDAIWLVNKIAHMRRLVEIFDRYPLRAKKARDFAIWREGVIWRAATPFHIRTDSGPLPVLYEQMKATRAMPATLPRPERAEPRPTLFP